MLWICVPHFPASHSRHSSGIPVYYQLPGNTSILARKSLVSRVRHIVPFSWKSQEDSALAQLAGLASWPACQLRPALGQSIASIPLSVATTSTLEASST